MPSQFQGVLRKKSFKGNSTLPMNQRFKSVRTGCASAHSNLKLPSRGNPTGQAINHFLFSHGERRFFFDHEIHEKHESGGNGEGSYATHFQKIIKKNPVDYSTGEKYFY